MYELLRKRDFERCQVAEAMVSNEVIFAALLLGRTGFGLVYTFVAIFNGGLLHGFWISIIVASLDSAVRRIAEEFLLIDNVA